MSNTYEFNAEEEVTFRSLSVFMLIASLLFFITAVIAIVTIFYIEESQVVFFVIFGITMLLMGFTFALPIDNFRRIIKTEKNDIKELIDAFIEIRFLWTTAAAILIIYRVFVFITFFL